MWDRRLIFGDVQRGREERAEARAAQHVSSLRSMAHARGAATVFGGLLDAGAVRHEPQNDGQCPFRRGKGNQYGRRQDGGHDKRFHAVVIGAAFEKCRALPDTRATVGLSFIFDAACSDVCGHCDGANPAADPRRPRCGRKSRSSSERGPSRAR
nr:hypothetical protein [uncultured bacterium]